jgi:hypothetical protein
MTIIEHYNPVNNLTIKDHPLDALVPPTEPYIPELTRIAWANVIYDIDPEIGKLAEDETYHTFGSVISAKEAEHQRQDMLERIADILIQQPSSCYLGLQSGSINTVTRLFSSHLIPQEYAPRVFNLRLKNTGDKNFGPALSYDVASAVRQASFVIIRQSTLISAAHLATLTEELYSLKKEKPYDTNFVGDFFRPTQDRSLINERYVQLVEKMDMAGIIPAISFYQNLSFFMTLHNRTLSHAKDENPSLWTTYTSTLISHSHTFSTPDKQLMGEGHGLDVSVTQLAPYIDSELLKNPMIAFLFADGDRIQLRIGSTIDGIVRLDMPNEDFIQWVAGQVNVLLRKKYSSDR